MRRRRAAAVRRRLWLRSRWVTHYEDELLYLDGALKVRQRLPPTVCVDPTPLTLEASSERGLGTVGIGLLDKVGYIEPVPAGDWLVPSGTSLATIGLYFYLLIFIQNALIYCIYVVGVLHGRARAHHEVV